MALILGLRDVADYTSNERPKTWRGAIQREMPQVAPLNVMLAGTKKEATKDPEFNWFEKSISARHTAANYSTGYASTVTTITVDSAKIFRAGDLIRNVSTDEVMRVTADPTDATTLVVARGWGSTAAAITDDDTLFCIGAAIAEGATARSSVYTDPTKVNNYTQIFRHPLKLTETARATQLRTGAAVQEMKREAMEQHVQDMERAYFFGVKYEDTSGSEPRRSTGGLSAFVTTNVTTVSGAGALTWLAFMNYLKSIFTYGAAEKVCFAGNQFINVLAQMAEARGDMNLTPKSSVYGIKMSEWVTPWGVVHIKPHPLFNEITEHSRMAFFIEPKRLVYKYLAGNGVNRDMKYIPGIQENDEDSFEAEFKSECGLEIHNERCHGIIKNVVSYSSS